MAELIAVAAFAGVMATIIVGVILNDVRPDAKLGERIIGVGAMFLIVGLALVILCQYYGVL